VSENDGTLSYVGNFKDSVQNGLGCMTWPDGIKNYDGGWKNGA